MKRVKNMRQFTDKDIGTIKNQITEYLVKIFNFQFDFKNYISRRIITRVQADEIYKYVSSHYPNISLTPLSTPLRPLITIAKQEIIEKERFIKIDNRDFQRSFERQLNKIKQEEEFFNLERYQYNH